MKPESSAVSMIFGRPEGVLFLKAFSSEQLSLVSTLELFHSVVSIPHLFSWFVLAARGSFSQGSWDDRFVYAPILGCQFNSMQIWEKCNCDLRNVCNKNCYNLSIQPLMKKYMNTSYETCNLLCEFVEQESILLCRGPFLRNIFPFQA